MTELLTTFDRLIRPLTSVVAAVIVLVTGQPTPSNALAQNTAPKPESPWTLCETNTNESFRGLDVVTQQLVWASGTNGTVLRTINAGKSWKKVTVPGAETLDFRDIEAFNEKQAVVISSGTPARIYRTEDGGDSWKLTYQHPSQQAFFDALSFWDSQHGIVMSDPVDDRILLIETRDGGQSWKELAPASRPKTIPGEGGFAASGTNMVILDDSTCLIALGAAKEGEVFTESRLLRSSDRGTSWSIRRVPIRRSPAGGIFSLAFAGTTGIAVGGDYLKPNLSTSNIAITSDGGRTWSRPTGEPPRGYRSGVALSRTSTGLLGIAVGTSGTDITLDGGETWLPASDDAFHAVQFTPDGAVAFASGSDGKIAIARRTRFQKNLDDK